MATLLTHHPLDLLHPALHRPLDPRSVAQVEHPSLVELVARVLVPCHTVLMKRHLAHRSHAPPVQRSGRGARGGGGGGGGGHAAKVGTSRDTALNGRLLVNSGRQVCGFLRTKFGGARARAGPSHHHVIITHARNSALAPRTILATTSSSTCSAIPFSSPFRLQPNFASSLEKGSIFFSNNMSSQNNHFTF